MLFQLFFAGTVLSRVSDAFNSLATKMGGGGFMPSPLSDNTLKDAIEQVIIPQFKDAFVSGGIPHWEPLAIETIVKKGHDTILVDSGDLEAGAISINTWQISGGVATMFDPVEYGHYHVTGTKHMPSRDFTSLDSDTADRLGEIVGQDVDIIINNTLVW